MPEKHIHKFRRHTYETGGVTYFCVLPDCTVKIKPALTLGKRTICWRCGEQFIMSEYSIKLAKPHCENCHKPKINKDEMKGIEAGLADVAAGRIVPLNVVRNDLSEMRARLSGETLVTEEDEI